MEWMDSMDIDGWIWSEFVGNVMCNLKFMAGNT